MNGRLAVAAVLALWHSVASAADEKTVIVPFPNSPIIDKSDVFYCDASVGTSLDGGDKKAMADFPSFIDSRGLGLSAKAYQSKDRMVIVVHSERKLLELFSRDEFEGGKSNQGYPYNIVDDKSGIIVATTTNDLVSPPPLSVITLSRKNGIATWTTVLPYDFITHNARIDAQYLTCGARKK